jgi:hypothetical protein
VGNAFATLCCTDPALLYCDEIAGLITVPVGGGGPRKPHAAVAFRLPGAFPPVLALPWPHPKPGRLLPARPGGVPPLPPTGAYLY